MLCRVGGVVDENIVLIRGLLSRVWARFILEVLCKIDENGSIKGNIVINKEVYERPTGEHKALCMKVTFILAISILPLLTTSRMSPFSLCSCSCSFILCKLVRMMPVFKSTLLWQVLATILKQSSYIQLICIEGCWPHPSPDTPHPIHSNG